MLGTPLERENQKMRRIVRGLAFVGLVAGVGFAVYTLTRLAKEGSAEQFDGVDPAPAPSVPSKKERDDEPQDPKKRSLPQPDTNQWPIVEPRSKS
jgi:hypothetical protein